MPERADMEVGSQLERFRKEHDDILRFLGEFQGALMQAHSAGDEERRGGLARLRQFEERLRTIREHCREEQQCLESPFRPYLDDSSVEALRREHEVLNQLTDAFLRELRQVALTPPTGQLVEIGRGLLETLRHHIAFEEGLLKQVEDGKTA